MDVLGGIIFIIGGLVACFMGEKLYRPVLILFGLFIGYHVAQSLFASSGDFIQIVGTIGIAAVTAFIFGYFVKFAARIIGAVVGLMIAGLIIPIFNMSGFLAVLTTVGLGAIGWFMGVRLAAMMLQAGTAFAGAVMIVSGIAATLAALGINVPLIDISFNSTKSADGSASTFTVIAVIALTVIGFMFQRRKPPAPAPTAAGTPPAS